MHTKWWLDNFMSHYSLLIPTYVYIRVNVQILLGCMCLLPSVYQLFIYNLWAVCLLIIYPLTNILLSTIYPNNLLSIFYPPITCLSFIYPRFYIYLLIYLFIHPSTYSIHLYFYNPASIVCQQPIIFISLSHLSIFYVVSIIHLFLCIYLFISSIYLTFVSTYQISMYLCVCLLLYQESQTHCFMYL